MDKVFSCAQAIRSAAPGISDDDVEEVVSAIIRRERDMPNRAGDALRWREIAAEKSAEELLKLKIEKHARQAALVARMRRDVAYDANRNKVQAISDRIVTSERAGAGRAASAEAFQHEARQAYVGGIVAAWRKAGVDAWLRRITPQDEEALAREIARLNGEKGLRATDSAEIRAAAEAVVGVQRLMREDANGAGAWVRELPGRVTRQAHDATRMQRAGFEGWRDFILPRLDERTWKDADVDPAEAEKLLRDVYNNLVSGNHHVAAPGELDPLAGFKGSGSLARRLSEDRVLHFRGADDWLAYNRQFGGANLVASIIAEAEHGAKSIGLMRVWGPNPDAAWQQDIQRLADSLRDTDGRLEDSNKLIASAGVGGKLWREWRVITGEGDRPVSRTWANIGAGWRTMETITSLGGVVLSSIPDLSTQASALRHEGVSYWRTLAHQTAALLPGVGGNLRREVATRLGAGLNGQLGGLYHRLGYDTAVPGRLAQAADWFFRLNLQTWWQDAQERGLSSLLSNHVGANLSRDWAGMDAGLRVSLERFGVTEADWAAMRGARLLEDTDGRSYFTPDMLESRDARARVGAWFTETMAGALTRPGAYEKSILTGGQAPGTAFGEAARLLTQFKSYPLTFITKHWSRELHRQGQADFGGIAGLIAGTSILGYVSMTLKDLAAGKNPRDPQNAGDWAKLVGTAMARGGGLGIYGDFLWGEYNRFGGGLASTAFGPAFGTAEAAFKLFGKVREGDDPTASALQFVTREALPTNLFYAKLALDHLVIHRLQEAVNPGYLRRLERRTQRENAQSYWLPPTAGQ